MVTNILILTKHHVKWNRTYFTLLISSIFITASFSSILTSYPITKSILITLLFISTLLFLLTTSLNANAVNNPGSPHFSWKFFQGLPMNKNEVIVSFGICSLISSIPLVLCAILFGDFVNSNLQTSFNFPKIAVNFSLFSLAMGMGSVKTLVEFPRLDESRKHPWRSVIRRIREVMILYLIACMCMLGYYFWAIRFNRDINHDFELIEKNFSDFFTSWWTSALFFTLALYTYSKTKKAWFDEFVTYNKEQWKLKKELLIMGSSLCTIVFTAYFFSTIPPEKFSGSIQTAVYNRHYELIDKISYDQANSPNQYGMTPMMVAVTIGDLKMIQLLESKGASFEGNMYKHGYDNTILAIHSDDLSTLKYVASRTNNLGRLVKEVGFYPIHFAAFKCRSDMVDFLIEQKVDVNVLNIKGETPLMKAVEQNCFSVAVSLKEAGARFDIKDASGKTALTRLKDPFENKEFQYFLQKNSRIPASQ